MFTLYEYIRLKHAKLVMFDILKPIMCNDTLYFCLVALNKSKRTVMNLVKIVDLLKK
jgi:hypothetical protein